MAAERDSSPSACVTATLHHPRSFPFLTPLVFSNPQLSLLHLPPFALTREPCRG